MKRIVPAAVLLAAFLACSKSRTAAPAAVSAPAPAPAPAGAMLSGKVIETMDAGGYTYLKLRTASGDVWAAVQQTKVAVGSTATVAPQLTMDNFESKTLKRTFDHIVFAVMSGARTSGPQSPDVSSGDQSPSVVRPEVGRLRTGGPLSMTPAQTVAEIWAKPKTLENKPVVVRGRVVKFLPAIMGKNWLHLRDGSGTRAKGDDDITVTTSDRAAIGDVIVVSGTLRVDKDFGAGYRYPVIIEEAKVTK